MPRKVSTAENLTKVFRSASGAIDRYAANRRSSLREALTLREAGARAKLLEEETAPEAVATRRAVRGQQRAEATEYASPQATELRTREREVGIAATQDALAPERRGLEYVGRLDALRRAGVDVAMMGSSIAAGENYMEAARKAWDPQKMILSPDDQLKLAHAEYYRKLAETKGVDVNPSKFETIFAGFNEMIPRFVQSVGPGILEAATKASGVKGIQNKQDEMRLQSAISQAWNDYLANKDNAEDPYRAKLGDVADFPAAFTLDALTRATWVQFVGQDYYQPQGGPGIRGAIGALGGAIVNRLSGQYTRATRTPEQAIEEGDIDALIDQMYSTGSPLGPIGSNVPAIGRRVPLE